MNISYSDQKNNYILHAHACMHILVTMRTTIEISDNLREHLLVEAHRSGQRGFSGIVEEALHRYFAEKTENSNNRKELIHELFGSEKEDSSELNIETRGKWRTGR